MKEHIRKTAVVLDEHPLWLEALEGVLRRVGVELLSKANRPSEALARLEEHRPALFVFDPQARDAALDGLECLRKARERIPSLKAVAVAATDEPRQVDAAFSAGVWAYVVKRAHPDDMAVAIRQAFEHSLYLANARRSGSQTADAAARAGLTRRECQILRLVAEGRSNKEVARLLWVTEQTVKFHLANVFRKLEVGNRTQAGRWAYAHGLLDALNGEATAAAGTNGSEPLAAALR